MHLKFFQYPPRSDASSVTPPAAPKRERWFPIGFWKRQVRTWHWMSGAVCLIGMLLFALTGITLNHAGQIPASPRTVERTMVLDALLESQRVSAGQRLLVSSDRRRLVQPPLHLVMLAARLGLPD